MKNMDKKVAALRWRGEFLRLVREFFHREGYLEVETPLLSPALIPEPAIEVFATEFVHPYQPNRPVYLVPSPELWMKRLLACDVGDIFQITKCFRNAETLGRHHNPEFSMLEWYSVGRDYKDSIRFTDKLLAFLNARFSAPADSFPELPLARLSMREAFRQYLSLELDLLFEKSALLDAAARLGLPVRSTDSWEVLFHQVFLTFIEPQLIREPAVILYDYPAPIVTLAESCPDPHYSRRWELYLGGVEIANCYSEEIDPRRLGELLATEAARKQASLVPHKPDLALADWFGPDYPRCSGTALGLDRLFMCYCDLSSIDEALFFPFSEIFLE